MVEKIEADGVYRNGGRRLLRRSAAVYQGGGVAYDCLALRMAAPGPPLGK